MKNEPTLHEAKISLKKEIIKEYSILYQYLLLLKEPT